MTGKEAQLEFARIEATLGEAIWELVETPTAVDRWPASLQAAMVALQSANSQLSVSARNGSFFPLVERLQSRVKQVHLLLESAALFYCGCVAVRATQAGGYTPAGALEPWTGGSRLQLEA